jgi:hypothetical protein
LSQLALELPREEPRALDPRTVLPAPVGARIASLAECMRVAEEECSRAGRPDGFAYLCPSGPLRGKGIEVYRAHVREILGRLERGEALEPGTDAECLCACLYAAGDAPLRQEGQALTEWLFTSVFPARAAEILGAERTRERWNGQVQEDLAQLRRRLAVTRRAA